MDSKTVVFIHGMYMNPLCWEGWVKRFEVKGYRCLALAWPGRDKSVKELQNAEPALGSLNLSRVVDHLADQIKGLDEKPILIGHSMGALATQLLLQRDLASAAIAIDSAPPTGVFTTTFSFIKANWGHVTPFANQNSPVIMTFERFQYAFVNDMPHSRDMLCLNHDLSRANLCSGQKLTSGKHMRLCLSSQAGTTTLFRLI